MRQHVSLTSSFLLRTSFISNSENSQGMSGSEWLRSIIVR